MNTGSRRRERKYEEMSSIGQSIVMALTVTVNKLASSNLQAVPRSSAISDPDVGIGRRGLLFSSLLITTPQASDSRTLLLQSTLPLSSASSFSHFRSQPYSLLFLLPEYLKKSQENKDKNDRQVKHFLAPFRSFTWV